MNKLRTIATKIKDNLLEYYTILLLTVGLPFIAFIYVDIWLAISVCILVQVVICFYAVKGEAK